MSKKINSLIIAGGLLATYELWRRMGQNVIQTNADSYLEQADSYGQNSGKGNLIGVQPYMLPEDYVSEASFFHKLDSYLAAAQERGWLNEKTVVIFPEYIGTWLVVAGEKASVYRAANVYSALTTITLSNLYGLLRWLPCTSVQNPLKYVLFRLKAESMAAIYHSVFSRLAGDYGVTIVAGSIVLPQPELSGERLTVHNGPLYNVSIVYRPDGTPHPQVVRKVYPVPDELDFTARGSEADLPVFDTPAGRLGVLICADAWYPSPYAVLKEKGVELVAVPSYASHSNHWQSPWGGYVPTEVPPDDLKSEDVSGLTTRQAWLKYALPGRLASSGAHTGINVFLRGKIWDLGADGHTIMVRDGRTSQAAYVDGATLSNLWLG